MLYSCHFLFRMYLLVDISASLCGWSREIKSLLRVIQIPQMSGQFSFSKVKAESCFVDSSLKFSLVDLQVVLMSAVHNNK